MLTKYDYISHQFVVILPKHYFIVIKIISILSYYNLTLTVNKKQNNGHNKCILEFACFYIRIARCILRRNFHIMLTLLYILVNSRDKPEPIIIHSYAFGEIRHNIHAGQRM